MGKLYTSISLKFRQITMKTSQTINSIYSRISRILNLKAATLSGAIDVIVIEYPCKLIFPFLKKKIKFCSKLVNFLSTPFHIRFGKLKLFTTKNTVVNVEVNGKLVHVKMQIGLAGEAFFITHEREFNSSSYLYSLSTTKKRSNKKTKDANYNTFETCLRGKNLSNNLKVLKQNTIIMVLKMEHLNPELQNGIKETFNYEKDKVRSFYKKVYLWWSWGDFPGRNKDRAK